MQIPRFFIDSSNINENVSLAMIGDPKLVHQIARVLRLGKGAPVILLNGSGDLFHCRIENQDRDSVALFIERKETDRDAGRSSLTVALPLIKPSRFEWALEKLTELGATTIIPLITQRTVQKSNESGETAEDGKKKDYKGSHVKQVRHGKLDRWHSIVKEASEQSERFAIPEVVAPKKLEDYLKLIAEQKNTESSLHYILAERKECPHLSIHLAGELEKGDLPKNISVCLGPEGGFTDAELDAAAKAGLISASLGKLILRSETAAVAATAVISAMRMHK